MNGQWIEVPVQAPQPEGFAQGGLLVVGAYDVEGGGFPPNSFEIWHQASGELMFEICAGEDRALEIAEHLAGLADWASISTTDEFMVRVKLTAFASDYPR